MSVCKSCEAPIEWVARDFDVDQSTISYLARRKTWFCVDESASEVPR